MSSTNADVESSSKRQELTSESKRKRSVDDETDETKDVDKKRSKTLRTDDASCNAGAVPARVCKKVRKTRKATGKVIPRPARRVRVTKGSGKVNEDDKGPGDQSALVPATPSNGNVPFAQPEEEAFSQTFKPSLPKRKRSIDDDVDSSEELNGKKTKIRGKDQATLDTAKGAAAFPAKIKAGETVNEVEAATRAVTVTVEKITEEPLKTQDRSTRSCSEAVVPVSTASVEKTSEDTNDFDNDEFVFTEGPNEYTRVDLEDYLGYFDDEVVEFEDATPVAKPGDKIYTPAPALAPIITAQQHLEAQAKWESEQGQD